MGQWIDFGELRRRVSLEDILVRLYGITNLTREGDKLTGPCPVHGGDSPRAFHADLGKNVWHCFSKCQGGGNQLDFVAKKEQVSVRDAALKVLAAFPSGEPLPTSPAAQAGTAEPAKGVPAAKVEFPTKKLAPKADDDTPNVPLTFRLQLREDHPYLVDSQKLGAQTIADFGAGYCAQGILRGMVAIPVHDEDGDLIAYVGRRLKPADVREHGKYKLPKGFRKDRVLFNYHRAKGVMAEQGLVVVAGFFGAMHLAEAGFPNAVATMGVEVSSHQAALLSTAKDLVVLFDGSEAGQAGAESLRTQIGGAIPVRVVRLPPGMKSDQCAPRLLRWLINGIRALDLAEVTFVPQGR
jgi:DNA primase